jgi:hypothetical protein
MLQVAKCSFNAIGCISRNENDELDNEWVVKHRTLSINMNELVQVGGVALEDLPQRTFTSGSEYFLVSTLQWTVERNTLHVVYSGN